MKVIYSHALMMQHFQNSLELFLKGHAVLNWIRLVNLISGFRENRCIITRDRMSQMGHYFIIFSIRCHLSNVDVSLFSFNN